ncbi:RDH13 [Symbiodinium necroappetens]|uniref:RDH13 protein n=1 Tax=Symbiodinium necroappetens TaxID=1628268 RepID=A0A813AVP7_9DINO|nr:RDH13 [Symbiodinium necroappetens]
MVAAVARTASMLETDLKGLLGSATLDALILNAGCLNLEKSSTKQGLEMTMGVCHFGHFLFTALVWPCLSADARIVPVSSVGHTWTKTGIDFEDINWDKRNYDAYEVYFQAKLANVYFTKELGRRSEAAGLKITATTLSPGFGRSGLYRDFTGCMDCVAGWVSEENDKLSINTMRAATDMTLKNGDYLVPKRMGFYGPPIVVPASELSEDKTIATKLWAKSEEIVGQKFQIG